MTDGPTAVTVVALLASIGALCFAVTTGSRGLTGLAVTLTVLLAVSATVQTRFARKQQPVIRLQYAKGSPESPPNAMEAIAARLQFDVVLSPRTAADATFSAIASAQDLDGFVRQYPINIAAPTDDSPFFFQMLRLRDMFDADRWQQGAMTFNMNAVFILGTLLCVVIGLAIACIIVPLILTTQKGALRGATALFVFFAAIGLGFMLIEISQMQRLIVFLGHPTYGLSVVMFSLLLSSGLGSASTQVRDDSAALRSARRRLLLLAALIVFGMLTPQATSAFRESTNAVRIVVASAVLMPLGFFMGMAFPLGIRVASARWDSVTPWLWGINGATSVCGSVLATAIALSAGIAVSFWSGFVCYAVALCALLWIRSQHRSPEPA